MKKVVNIKSEKKSKIDIAVLMIFFQETNSLVRYLSKLR